MVGQVRAKNIEHGHLVPGFVHNTKQFRAKLLRRSRFTAQNCSHLTYDIVINLRDPDFYADHSLLASSATMSCQRVVLSSR